MAALPSVDDLVGAMGMTRVGLFIIAVLSIGVIVVALVNLKMGTGGASSVKKGDLEHDEQGSKKSAVYPNMTRDYIVLAASVLSFLVSAISVFMTYPKKA